MLRTIIFCSSFAHNVQQITSHKHTPIKFCFLVLWMVYGNHLENFQHTRVSYIYEVFTIFQALF